MQSESAKQSNSKDATKEVSHTPRAGTRTLMLSFIKSMSESRYGHSNIEILPPLTEHDYSRILYTQRYVNPTFSNYSSMNVFETYFAIKYTFMLVTELPPIRVFKADGQLWSVDNRRLWIMKQANKFHCEGPFTKEQCATYFNEVVIKRRSLKCGSGVHVQFHHDPLHACCITAFNQGKLDIHFAEVHLKVSLESIRCLAKVKCFDNPAMGNHNLHFRIHERCVILKRIMNHIHLPPTQNLYQLFSAFDQSLLQ
ncbi:unnamed protein product [Adineta steineri]|uniref:Uncharacterized protein n=1 Tax=Adineta steineri TaxID=433720 RepID=A0A815SIM3_9BILA|nr:unnamed protein product [Adineta steineri]CAF4162376.1 unnamed protein product [Adineta steineri]